MSKTDNVIPLGANVCRNCPPSVRCSECDWLGKLLDQETTLHDIAEKRREE